VPKHFRESNRVNFRFDGICSHGMPGAMWRQDVFAIRILISDTEFGKFRIKPSPPKSFFGDWFVVFFDEINAAAQVEMLD